MTGIKEAAFDKIARQYDVLWSETPIGRSQRSAVWSRIDLLFEKDDFVLDAGCGTGIDALHLNSRGVSVYGIDSSPQMVEIARSRGVNAHCCPIERLEFYDLRLDGVLSNFGALNCVESLRPVASSFARMVRPGGYLALCFLSPVCIWEVCFHLLHADPGKAFRRLRGRAQSSIGTEVFYPSGAAIVSAFTGPFRLVNFYGIGVSVPPSYVKTLTHWEVEQLALLDVRLAHQPVLRLLADHRLYIFERI
jgi:SAM-dependent methyltransferase